MLPQKQIYRVLILDDSIADSDILKHLLAQDILHNYDITQADTGRLALQRCQLNPPHLLLVDFSLPDMTGLDFFKSLQCLNPSSRIPGILLTGHGNEAIALAAMKHNIQDYIPKKELNFHRLMQGVYSILLGDATHQFSPQQPIQAVIVDDAPADLEVYRRFLQSDPEATFVVHTFEDAQEALAALETLKVDVLLVDHAMPDMTGLDFIAALRPDCHAVLSIIMMTGSGDERLVIQAIKAGAADYLVKQTITPESLRKVLKQTVQSRRLMAQIDEMQSQRSLLSKISLDIRGRINLQEVLDTAVGEVRQYLACDRAIIYQLQEDAIGKVVAESRSNTVTPLLGQEIADTYFQSSHQRREYAENCHKQIVNNILEANLSPCHRQMLENFGVKSVLTLPIVVNSLDPPLWGLFIIHYCHQFHSWSVSDITFLSELALQIGFGIHQGLLVEEIRQERDRANRATAAKSLFLANMSHEIRTPMNGILGMAELLALSPTLSPRDRDFLAVIESNGRSLLNLINDILDLSKLEAGRIELEMKEFSLDQITQETIDLFQFTCRDKGLSLAVDMDPNLPSQVIGDPYRIRQVLNNLLGNAVKFTERGGITLRIFPQNCKIPEKAHVLQICFEVIDTGLGIGPEDQARLFQPFVQVENSSTRRFQGTGLGLSICKKLVEETMRGSIGLRSTPNEGSTFWFALPLRFVPDPIATVENTERQLLRAADPLPRSISVLVVEDNLHNQQVIQSQLEVLACRCDLATHGQEALEKLKQHTYDLILMDCQMPVLDGYATTRQIRQNPDWATVPVVGITAYAMVGDRDKCLAAGMNDYLTKPYTLGAIEALLQKWL